MLPSTWTDNGLALIPPKAPDGNQYFFSDASGMRELALHLLAENVISGDDMAIENAAQVSPDRVEQCTQFGCLVVQHDNKSGKWTGFRSNLGAEHLKASGRHPVVLPIPQPPAPADPNKAKLARTQKALGTDTLGVYFGTWTCNFRAPDFAPHAKKAKDMGVDYVMVKFGEWGNKWYANTEKDINTVFTDNGLKMVPFWYCRPQTWHEDMQHCAELAQEFGMIDLDVEEVFLNVQNGRIVGNFGSELQGIFDGIRKAAPESLIIADGYGDPMTAFAGTFPYWAINQADCYQPQWYESFYGARTWDEWRNGLARHDVQCGEVFQQAKLGLSFPIRPCVSSQNVSPDVAYDIGHYLSSFHTGLMLWEFTQCTADVARAFKSGLHAK